MTSDFAGAIKFILTTRGLTQLDIANLAGVKRGTVSTWIAKKHIPSPEVVARLATALDAPFIVRAASKERERKCADCGRVFMAFNRRSAARFCSGACRDRWWHIVRTAKTAQARKDHLTLFQTKADDMAIQRDKLEAAIAMHCRECEPEGMCRDARCAIQKAGVSPLKLSKRRLG